MGAKYEYNFSLLAFMHPTALDPLCSLKKHVESKSPILSQRILGGGRKPFYAFAIISEP